MEEEEEKEKKRNRSVKGKGRGEKDVGEEKGRGNLSSRAHLELRWAPPAR